MIAGERDGRVLAEMAKGKMRAKIPDLTEALTGHFDVHHAQLAGSILHRLDLVEEALAQLDAVIADACAPWARQIELLQTIPGVGVKVAQVIVAETGGDMSRFPSAAHLAAWAGVAPAIHESAGKRLPTGARHGNKWLTTMLVEAAGSVGRMKGKNYLAAQHARLTARRGMGRAQVAVAHSILVSAYYMLSRDEPYRDLGADWLARRNTEAHPPAGGPARTARSHRGPRPRRLSRGKNTPGCARGADARLQLTYSRVCVALDLGLP
jgi:transposase